MNFYVLAFLYTYGKKLFLLKCRWEVNSVNKVYMVNHMIITLLYSLFTKHGMEKINKKDVAGQMRFLHRSFS